MSSIQSQAVGFMLNTQQSVDTYVTDKVTDYRFESSTYAMDSSGTYEQEIIEKFIDGKYSVSVDGGEESFESSVTAALVESVASSQLKSNMLALILKTKTTSIQVLLTL